MLPLFLTPRHLVFCHNIPAAKETTLDKEHLDLDSDQVEREKVEGMLAKNTLDLRHLDSMTASTQVLRTMVGSTLSLI